MVTAENKPKEPGLRRWLFEVIFEADTTAGKTFDIALLLTILFSILVVMLESVDSYETTHGEMLRRAEWIVTVLFTLEYVLRIYCCDRPKDYVFGFYGLIDLLAVIPTYLSLLLVGTQYLVVIRTIRLLRVFRILKMSRYIGEANVLLNALKASQPKITVFLVSVVSAVVIVGALMHLIEGPENGFTSIPRSMYWAVVTLTTVGYGDIAPQTIPGQLLATVLMIFGYGIIAVPTGIVSVELSKAQDRSERRCGECNFAERDAEARFCRRCGKTI